MPRYAPHVVVAMILACASGDPPKPQPLPPRLPAEEFLEAEGDRTQARAPADVETGPLTLSLEEAAISALQHNPDLRVQRLAPAVAGAFALAARGEYDPELHARFQYGVERFVETARSTQDRFDVDAQASTGVLGVRQRIPTGTTLEATVEQTSSDSNRTPRQETARVGLSITQALLRGFGPAVNLAAIDQADLEVQASVYELRGYAEAVLADTEITYWRYVLAAREIAIHEESLAVSRRQSGEIDREIAVGTLAQTEAAAASAEVALREQALIDARSAKEAQRLRLLRLVGADLQREVVASSDPHLEPNPLDDLDERLQLAQRSRPEINEALLRLEQRRLDTVVTRNGTLPNLELFVALGKTGFGDDFAESFRRIDSNTFDVAGGVRFSAFFRNRAAEGANRAAMVSHRQAKQAVENLRSLVALEVCLAANAVERARQQITASAATAALQEQKVLAERERFRVGESTALLVAQAQRDLLSSRIAEVEALVDYRAALVQLYLAEGTLLERRGLRLGM